MKAKSIRVKRHLYDVYTRNEYGEPEIILVPRTGGSTARSSVSLESYAYTHGGEVFRAAVEKAKELEAYIDELPARPWQ